LEKSRLQFIVKGGAFAGNELGDDEYLDSEDITGPLSIVYKKAFLF
jgi:hypothetical protein